MLGGMKQDKQSRRSLPSFGGLRRGFPGEVVWQQSVGRSKRGILRECIPR